MFSAVRPILSSPTDESHSAVVTGRCHPQAFPIHMPLETRACTKLDTKDAEVSLWTPPVPDTSCYRLTVKVASVIPNAKPA